MNNDNNSIKVEEVVIDDRSAQEIKVNDVLEVYCENNCTFRKNKNM